MEKIPVSDRDEEERSDLVRQRQEAESRAQKLEQTSENQSAALKAEKTKRRSKPGVVAALLLLIALLGGAATLAVYKLYFEKPTVDTPAPATNNSVEPKKLSARETIDQLKPLIIGDERVGASGGVGPAVILDGYDFYVSPAGGSPDSIITAKSSSVDEADRSVDAIRNFLKGKDFEEHKVNTNSENATYSTFLSNDVACAVSSVLGGNVETDYTTSVACTDMSVYESIAKKAEPMVRAYLASDEGKVNYGDDNKLVVAGSPTVNTSPVSGYSNASLSLGGFDGRELGVGGFAGLFYKTPGSDWRFFMGTQSVLSCDKYIDDDVKKSFAGDVCFDGQTESTVKP